MTLDPAILKRAQDLRRLAERAGTPAEAQAAKVSTRNSMLSFFNMADSFPLDVNGQKRVYSTFCIQDLPSKQKKKAY